MSKGLYAPLLDKLRPANMVRARRPATSLQAAMAMAAAAPTNDKVLDACRTAINSRIPWIRPR